jgi:iron complex outermembrane receptor protein
LRGASTLRTGEAQEPYYVIDGVPGMSLSLVAPEDIESIDVYVMHLQRQSMAQKQPTELLSLQRRKGIRMGRPI